MTGDKTFFTATMADLLSKQGRYEEAARIYRYLLEQDPRRTDLSSCLDDVVAKLSENERNWEDITGTIEEWVRLIIAQRMLGCISRLGQTPIGKGLSQLERK